jgi:hypothetical protein
MTVDIVTQMQADNLVRWQETEAIKIGTKNQRERYAAGVLPEDELLILVRQELFRGLDAAGLPRWHTRDNRKLLEREMRHKPGCANTGNPTWTVHYQPSAVWEVGELAELDHVGWERWKRIGDEVTYLNTRHEWIAPTIRCSCPRANGVTLHSHALPAMRSGCAHWLTCPECDHEEVRSVAKVSIAWAGRNLTREYTL